MDMLAALAAEKETLLDEARASGLSPEAFGVALLLRDDPVLIAAGVEAKSLAADIAGIQHRFPNAQVNADEARRFRAMLYRPLLSLPKEESARIVDVIMRTLFNQ